MNNCQLIIYSKKKSQFYNLLDISDNILGKIFLNW